MLTIEIGLFTETKPTSEAATVMPTQSPLVRLPAARKAAGG
jgi:hypothetical protein